MCLSGMLNMTYHFFLFVIRRLSMLQFRSVNTVSSLHFLLASFFHFLLPLVTSFFFLFFFPSCYFLFFAFCFSFTLSFCIMCIFSLGSQSLYTIDNVLSFRLTVRGVCPERSTYNFSSSLLMNDAIVYGLNRR